MLFNLSFKIFLRDLRSGYLTSILVSLVLAITIVSGISLFTDRLEKALSAETEEFLGGNLKFESNQNTAKSKICLLYTSPSPRDGLLSRMPSSA